MSDDRSWVRLPGLFRWSEVCDAFALHSNGEEDWHFVIKPHSVTAELELLYVVHAVEGTTRSAAPALYRRTNATPAQRAR